VTQSPNTRVKDYFDLRVLLDRESLNINALAQAAAATFVRRGMLVPTEVPVGLTDEFANDLSRPGCILLPGRSSSLTGAQFVPALKMTKEANA
jgi:hypothetical protein